MVEHVVVLIVEHVTGNTGLVVAYSKENVPPILCCIFIQCVAVLDSHLCAAIILIEVEVHHAGNRV